jgi:putative ABC transport system permease protein
MLTNIRVALNGLGANKMRSALTVLGITIGVAVVIILVSLGQGVESFILDQFSLFGSDLVYVFGEIEDSLGQPAWLTQTDADALANPYRVPDGLYAMPAIELSGFDALNVTYGEETSEVNVYGATPLWPALINQDVAFGRFFTDDETVSGARVAVIGQTVVENLFQGVAPIIGKDIRIGNVSLEIIGVLEDVGTGSFGGAMDMDNVVVMPLSTVQRRLLGERTSDGGRPVTWIAIQARDESRVDAVVLQAQQTLREEHDIRFQDEDDFTVVTQTDLMESVATITGLLTIFLGAIAGISLLVGGIGIMNIMLVTVTERTREIGIRKAVGAQKLDILSQFLTEAIILALFGGSIGVGMAWLLTNLIGSSMPDLDVSIRLSSIFLATGVSIAVGIFFGIYPANRAAALSPIDALRYE